MVSQDSKTLQHTKVWYIDQFVLEGGAYITFYPIKRRVRDPLTNEKLFYINSNQSRVLLFRLYYHWWFYGR